MQLYNTKGVRIKRDSLIWHVKRFLAIGNSKELKYICLWTIFSPTTTTTFIFLKFLPIGFYLKGDVSAKQSANAKYGETHGKGACQLGLVGCQKSKIRFGSLTNAFHAIPDNQQKIRLSKLLCFRIPIIQTLLNKAQKGNPKIGHY